jgi:tetratricopeptide (TPR) repeat protein
MYQKVLADTERRAAADPSSAGLQRELARTHQITGDMFAGIPGHEQEMRLHIRAAIAIADRLAAFDPSDKTAQSELAQYLSSGAEGLALSADRQEGVGYLRRALPILQGLLKSEPDSGVFQLYLALVESDLGDLLGRTSLNTESIRWLRRGLADMTKLAERDPGNTTNWLEVLKIQRMLVDNLARAGQQRESLALAQDVIDKARSVGAQVGPRQELLRRELPRAYAAMAGACRTLRKPDEARNWYRLAMKEWETMRAEGLQSPDTQREMEDSRKSMATSASVISSVPSPGR